MLGTLPGIGEPGPRTWRKVQDTESGDIMKEHTNLFTRIDEGMTTRDDTHILVIGIFLVIVGSFIVGVAVGSLIEMLIR